METETSTELATDDACIPIDNPRMGSSIQVHKERRCFIASTNDFASGDRNAKDPIGAVSQTLCSMRLVVAVVAALLGFGALGL